MSIKSTVKFVVVVFIGFTISPTYSGDIISCDSFESCPDGSVPMTNALLALQARMDALEAENEALKASLAANTAADDSAHHTKYTDAESLAAVGPHFGGSHADLKNVVADQHHTGYSDANAIAAVGPHSPDYSLLLAGVSRGVDPNTSEDTLTFTDMNVQVVSGSGNTDGDITGTGNIIIGYNELGNAYDDDRSGSHTLVIGQGNSYSSFGGMVAGQINTVSAEFAFVGGGQYNHASGGLSSISGGFNNTASGFAASVSGGFQNIANTDHASVSGGNDNTASGIAASISGGRFNIASADNASVSGGAENAADSQWSSVSGGRSNIASGESASVSGGGSNTASGEASSVSGGDINIASGVNASVAGGQEKTAAVDNCIVGDNGVDCLPPPE